MAVAGLGLTPLAAKAHWASYAYSPSSDYGFASYQHLTRAAAEQAALQGCGQGQSQQSPGQSPQTNNDCKVLASAPSPLWLVIVQTPNQLFWGGDPFRKLAEENTIRRCRRQTEKQPDKPQCQIRLVIYPSSGIQESLYRPKPPAAKPDAQPAPATPRSEPSPSPAAKP
jgi:Domain of unknown function (DUF4189)